MNETEVKKGVIARLVGDKGTILVMDDEESIREVLAAMLQAGGYDVALAADGVEAIQLYKKARESGHPFVGAIMDLTIPGGSGAEEVVKELISIDPNVRAIVTSGYLHDPVVENYEDHGFKGALTKPFRIEELRGVLESVLAERR